MAGTETITLKIVAVDLLSGNVTKAISGLDKLAQRGGLVGSVMQGVGQSFGQMLNPVGLATRGIGMLTDTLGDSLRAFQEDQKSQLQLRAALEANIESWDGNTDAIERTIDARTRLGFADDAQRESLASLVTVTENVNDALKIQRTAMDLARLKGIDLASAAKVLGNAYAGATGQLAKMGIRLGKGVSGMEALEAVQERVSGQAEAYAKSSIGKMEALDIKVDELKESIGGLMQGPADMFVGWLSSVVDVLDGPDGANAQVKDLAAEVRNLYTAAANTGAKMPWDIMAEGIQRSTDELEQLRYAIPEAYFPLVEALGPRTRYSLGATSDSLADLADAAVRSGFGFRFLVDQVLSARAGANFLTGTWGRQSVVFAESLDVMSMSIQDFEASWKAAGSAAKDTGDWKAWSRFLVANADYVNEHFRELPVWLRDAADAAGIVLSETKARAIGGIGSMVDGMGARMRDAPTVIRAALEPLTGIVKGTLGEAKEQAKRDMADLAWALKHPMADSDLRKVWSTELNGAYKALHRAQESGNRIAIAKAQALIDGLNAKLFELDMASLALRVDVDVRSNVPLGPVTSPPTPGGRRKKPKGKKAMGGPVSAGGTYLVGEEGPELLTMGTSSGHVTPNHQAGGVHVHLHGLLAAPTEAETSRIARTLGPALRREMARAG